MLFRQAHSKLNAVGIRNDVSTWAVKEWRLFVTVERIMEIARECGFDEVNLLDPKTFVQSQMVRDTCATNKCGGFGANWGCPPHSTAEEDNAKLQSYEHSLILQCIGRSA